MSQQSNPATLREALRAQLEERARQECPKGSHEDHECETCEHCHYYVDTAWIGVETALAASGTEAAPVTCESCKSTNTQRYENAGGLKMYCCADCRWHHEVPSQAAASPEGEGREAANAEAEVWLERNGYPYLEQMFNEFVDGPISRSRMNRLLAPLFVKYAALRQSAAPSGGDLREAWNEYLSFTQMFSDCPECDSTEGRAHSAECHLYKLQVALSRMLAQESKTGAVTETK